MGIVKIAEEMCQKSENDKCLKETNEDEYLDEKVS